MQFAWAPRSPRNSGESHYRQERRIVVELAESSFAAHFRREPDAPGLVCAIPSSELESFLHHVRPRGFVGPMLEESEESSPISPPSAITRLAPVHEESWDQRLVQALRRLRRTGQFSESQLKLIEAEIQELRESESSFIFAPLPKPGDCVDGWVIDELLGSGGEAHVFEVHDPENGERCAMKVLHNARTSERFRQEMKLVQELAHPNIVTAYEVGGIGDTPFITMELMEGPDLNARVRSAGPLDWLQSSQYVLQIARALAHAHSRDLIHRDVKPGNILLNGQDQVKLVDLGLASMRVGEAGDNSQFMHLTREAQIAGTLPYMAPEQARSLSEAGVCSDVYSLGASWFYLLTGNVRLCGDSFSQQFANLIAKRRFRELPRDCLPAELHSVFDRMVAYDLGERYQSCSLLAQDLEDALSACGESVNAEQLHVLIVEDSRSDMQLTIEYLRRANESLVIHQAETLAEALAAYETTRIDLVLLDLSLPDSSGVETVQDFRRSAAEVPVIVLSGMEDEEVAWACLEAGANEFFSKSDLTVHKMERVIFVTLSRHDHPKVK